MGVCTCSWQGFVLLPLALMMHLPSATRGAFLPPPPSSTLSGRSIKKASPSSFFPSTRSSYNHHRRRTSPIHTSPPKGVSRSLFSSSQQGMIGRGGTAALPYTPNEGEQVVVFVRHGQSDFNLYNIFTGWCDVDINAAGEQECRKAGMLLASLGFEFDLAYTSVLKRATKSLWCTLDGCDHTFIPIRMHWQLNERHYGALQGLSKEESEERMGPIVKEWRRSWDTKPPDMDETHPHWSIISQDRRYRDIQNVPRGESLEMCSVRVMDYWQREIVPTVQSGQRLLIMAHANSLRSLIKKLDNMTNDGIRKIKIPNGKPFMYRFDAEMNILGEPDENGFRGQFLEEVDISQSYRRKIKDLFREAPELPPDVFSGGSSSGKGGGGGGKVVVGGARVDKELFRQVPEVPPGVFSREGSDGSSSISGDGRMEGGEREEEEEEERLTAMGGGGGAGEGFYEREEVVIEGGSSSAAASGNKSDVPSREMVDREVLFR